MSFNPRAPCGARHVPIRVGSGGRVVSIHAPRAGRDDARAAVQAFGFGFNPRAPCGARPVCPHRFAPLFKVSIHAPRAGRDQAPSSHRPRVRQFQSTRPVRGATTRLQVGRRHGKFQSTRPVRGATTCVTAFSRLSIVSIHAPRAGRDVESAWFTRPRACFNPRAPCGARQACPCRSASGRTVSIHAPRAGRDTLRQSTASGASEFQSTRPVRGATT